MAQGSARRAGRAAGRGNARDRRQRSDRHHRDTGINPGDAGEHRCGQWHGDRGCDEVVRDADTMRIAGDMSEGNGVPAVLQPRGGSEVRAATVDIARSGLSCRCDWRATAGTEVPIELPEAGGPVIARIVRPEGGVLALVLPSGRGDAASSGLGTRVHFRDDCRGSLTIVPTASVALH